MHVAHHVPSRITRYAIRDTRYAIRIINMMDDADLQFT